MGCETVSLQGKHNLESLIERYLKDSCRQGVIDDLDGAKKMLTDGSIPDFLKRCVCNRKRHQWCISNAAVDCAVKKLSANYEELCDFDDFDDFDEFDKLYDRIYNLIGDGKTGISYSTVYDTAIRFGGSMETAVEPQRYVYVHQKLIQSAKHIVGRKSFSNNYRIEKSEFSKVCAAFEKLESLFIEDFLCVYHDEIMKL